MFKADLLDQRRTIVLTRVRNMVTSELELHRANYLESLQKINIWWPLPTMRAYFAYGYLQLESDRWLTRQRPGSGGEEFQGVSFNNVSNCIRTMLDLSKWKISTVPTADRMPRPMAIMLTSLLPLVGTAVSTDGLHGRLSDRSRAVLKGLIAEIEREDWGVDLAEISNHSQ